MKGDGWSLFIYPLSHVHINNMSLPYQLDVSLADLWVAELGSKDSLLVVEGQS